MNELNDPAETFNNSSLARLLGVSEGTIRQWTEKHGVPSRKVGTERVFSAAMKDVFLQIQEFRKIKASPETIALNISEQLRLEEDRIRDESPDMTGKYDSDSFGYESGLKRIREDLGTEIAQHNLIVAEALSQNQAAMTDLKDLAEKYGQAMMKLGQLQADNTHLLKALESERQKTLLLPAPEDLRQAQTEKDHLAKALEAEKEQRRAAESVAKKIEHDSVRLEESLARVQEEARKADTRAAELQAEKDQLLERQGEISQALESEKKKTWLQKLFGK